MILLLGVALDAHAGAWTRDQGDHYVKIAADHYRASGYVDPITGPVADYRYRGTQLGLYGELGVLRAWPVQVQGYLPLSLGSATFEEPITGELARASATRLGDARLSVQVALPGQTPMALAIELKVPLYANDRIGQGLAADLFPKPGDGQLDWTGWWLVGASVPRTSAWVEAAVGYRHRTETFLGWDTDLVFVDGIPFRAVLGATFGRTIPMLVLDGIENPKTEDVTREWVSVGPVLMHELVEGVALEARLSVDVRARNAPRGTGMGLGLSWRR